MRQYAALFKTKYEFIFITLLKHYICRIILNYESAFHTRGFKIYANQSIRFGEYRNSRVKCV